MSFEAQAWAWGIEPGSSTNKLVLLAVANRVSRKNGGPLETWAAQKTLATDTLLSERTVRKALAALEEATLIKRRPRRSGASYTSDVITLLAPSHVDGPRDGTTRKANRQSTSGSQRNELPPNQSVQNQSVESIPPHNTSCCVPPKGGHTPDDCSIETEDEALSSFDSRARTDKAERSSRSGRGTKIPHDWQPSQEDVAFAKSEHIKDVLREAAKFRDHYLAQSGKHGVSSDWSAKWRNWVRGSADRANRNQPSKQRKMAI